MATDKPSFLNGVDPTPDEQEIMDVLADNPDPGDNGEINDATPNDTQPATTETPSDTSGDGEQSSSDSGEGDAGGGDTPPAGGGEKPTEPTGDPKEGEQPAEGEAAKSEKQPEKPSDKEVERMLNLKFGTFKSPEEAEKAYKELQRTLTRLRQTATAPATTPTEKKEQQKAAEQYIALAKKTPLVDVKIPNSKDYVLDDGTYDMDNFARDLVHNTTMAFQQALVGGQLGSLQFGLLQEAMNDEIVAAKQQDQAHQRTTSIENKLYEQFPILKTNERVATRLEREIFGEVARRKAAAQKAGKEFEPMVEQDFLDLATDLLKDIKVEAADVPQEQADRVPRGVVAQPTGKAPLAEIDQDIEDMMNVKKKSGSIF
jgi:hypothetical protein